MIVLFYIDLFILICFILYSLIYFDLLFYIVLFILICCSPCLQSGCWVDYMNAGVHRAGGGSGESDVMGNDGYCQQMILKYWFDQAKKIIQKACKEEIVFMALLLDGLLIGRYWWMYVRVIEWMIWWKQRMRLKGYAITGWVRNDGNRNICIILNFGRMIEQQYLFFFSEGDYVQFVNTSYDRGKSNSPSRTILCVSDISPWSKWHFRQCDESLVTFSFM